MSKASNLAGFVPSIGIRSDLTVGIITASSVSVAQSITATNFYGNGSGLTGAGSTVADDTSTNATFYPVITQTTSGTITASKVSTTKLSFNPSTGTLNSSALGISGTTVVDSSRNLANIASFDSTVSSIYDTVTTTATSKTIVNREHVTVTANSQTITLPASPSAGWEVAISIGNFTGTIVGRNSTNIMGLAEDLTLDKAYTTTHLIYSGDATQGWRIF